jgi:hypothetical protein
MSDIEIAKHVMYYFCLGLVFVWAVIQADRVPKDNERK